MKPEHRLIQRLLWGIGEAHRQPPAEPEPTAPAVTERLPEVEAPPGTTPAAIAAALDIPSSAVRERTP